MNKARREMDVELPSLLLFDGVVGQDKAVSLLRASARNPVHAYLLTGRSGSCQRELWRRFAAALLCPDGGCGHCEWCSRCLRGTHPDLTEMESTGAALSVEEAHQLVRMAQRTPLIAKRQVLVVPDISEASLAAPVLLKTLEEPPGKTVFVLTASTLPQEIVTIASRCLKIELASNQSVPVSASSKSPSAANASQGAKGAKGSEGAGGMGGVRGGEEAGGAGGTEEAVEMEDAGETEEAGGVMGAGEAREAAQTVMETWASIPGSLAATGSTIAELADKMLLSVDNALEEIKEHQDKELKELDRSTSDLGIPNSAMRKHLVERQHRELRKERVAFIRGGLLALSREYENQLARLHGVNARSDAGSGSIGGTTVTTSHTIQSAMRSCIQAVEAVRETSAQLVRNPNEKLLLQALLIKLADI